MVKPQRKGPNPFYARKWQRYSLPPADYVADSPRKWERIKEILIHIGLFVSGLVVGTIAGLIALSLLERWLSNGG